MKIENLNKHINAYDDVAELINMIETESDLAELFAFAENTAWYIEDDVYAFEEGTEEWKAACENTDKWFAVDDQLKEKIFAILHSEGVIIPNIGQIKVLIPFMKRNGFINENGWWKQMEVADESESGIGTVHVK